MFVENFIMIKKELCIPTVKFSEKIIVLELNSLFIKRPNLGWNGKKYLYNLGLLAFAKVLGNDLHILPWILIIGE